jgi:hypothetical protein
LQQALAVRCGEVARQPERNAKDAAVSVLVADKGQRQKGNVRTLSADIATMAGEYFGRVIAELRQQGTAEAIGELQRRDQVKLAVRTVPSAEWKDEQARVEHGAGGGCLGHVGTRRVTVRKGEFGAETSRRLVLELLL